MAVETPRPVFLPCSHQGADSRLLASLLRGTMKEDIPFTHLHKRPTLGSPSCYLAPLTRYLLKPGRVCVAVSKGNQEGRDELCSHTLKEKSLSFHCG